MTVQELINMGYGGYAGWSDSAASADFNATGGVGKQTGGGGSTNGVISPEDYANKIIDAQKKQIEEETKFLEQYTAKNPFIFDEELARRSAVAEYEPYYAEILKDYTSDIELRRGSIQDEAKLLAKMREFDTASRSRSYQQAVGKAEEGFAGSGMFFSGNKARGVGEMNVDYTTGEQREGEIYGQRQKAYGTQLGALDTDLYRKSRDIEREKQASIESGILTRKKEAQTEYYMPLEQSYYRRFPSSGGSALRGYILPEYYQG